jgi:hypothetical protein
VAPQAAWQCSQCGTVNEAGTRACASCGKWPSLFDLQESVEEPRAADEPILVEVEPETFDPETFEAETFDPADAEAEAEERGRIPRRVITAIWVIGLLIWLVVNALRDSG